MTSAQQVVKDAPWVVTDEFLRAHSIDFVCHDALPYIDASGVSDNGDVYAHLKRAGRFVETRRTEGISTSDIITSILQLGWQEAGAVRSGRLKALHCRLLQDYDKFVRRNLRRGYSINDMNVSCLKEQAIKFGMVKERVAESIGKLIKKNPQAQALAENLQKAFVCVFNRDSAFRTR
ncbi:choline-phosphate cytidylyltransferase B [Tribonema minus]|uniref:choline-phosphate cytidylyltransferase n=1 Tax=Tribonema minus TaxID=303371 RepID=A0A835Z8U6_9STRA|nr:choline-phosphate cytidylyltransferase B [Tribonema minus]